MLHSSEPRALYQSALLAGVSREDATDAALEAIRMYSIGSWSAALDVDAYRDALELAKGSYQVAILQGSEALSGSTLRGAAKRYSGRYQASVRGLLRRLENAGIDVREVRQRRGGARVLVVVGRAA